MHAKQMPSSAQCSHRPPQSKPFSLVVSQSYAHKQLHLGVSYFLTGKMPEGGNREAIIHSVYNCVCFRSLLWHIQNGTRCT